MKRLQIPFICIITMFFIVILGSFSAFAKTDDDEVKDYSIDAFWNETNSLGKGDIFCAWTKPESKTNYTIDVYKFAEDSESNYKIVKKGENTSNRIKHIGSYSGTSVNIGTAIIDKGTGYYIFSVIPQKGGTSYKAVSDWISIDNTYLSNLSKYYENTYNYKSSVLKKSGTGGSSQTSVAYGGGSIGPGTIDQTQIQSDAANQHIVEKVSVTIGQKELQRGEIWTATIVKSDRAEVLSVEYSEPYEDWIAGKPVKITAVYKPANGWEFSDITKFECDNGDIVELDVDKTRASVTVSYVPRFKLKTPSNICIDSSDILRFDAVPSADRYIMKVLEMETLRGYTTFSSNYKDVSLYMQNADNPTFQIQATSTKNYIFDSDTAEFYTSSLVPAEDRENTLNGWKRVSGKWYHYTNGTQDGPGWFQDVDGYWYYFDADKAMVKGSLTMDGKEYKFNDGSVTGIPEGACINR